VDKYWEYEIGCKTKKGTIIWLSWHCKPNLEEGIIYFTGKNITAEKKLRELNRQTRQLAKIGSWEVDVLNQTLYWSGRSSSSNMRLIQQHLFPISTSFSTFTAMIFKNW
jgi:hypothetical protein